MQTPLPLPRSPSGDPLAPDPHAGIGPLQQVVSLLDSDEPQRALDVAQAALARPATAAAVRNDLLHLAGLAANATGQPAMAESLWRQGVDADPLQAAAWDRLGLLLMRRQRPLEAEPCHRRATELEPLNAAPHTHLGFALEAQARHDEALASHMRALACQPDHPSIHTNLGNVLSFLGREREAEFHHRQAIALAPDFAAAHCNLGVLLADQRRDAEAEHHLRAAMALRPGYPLARLNIGFLLLAQGRFAEGWPLHEARHDPALPDHGIPPPPWPIPAWAGEPLAGRSVLVWAEQGFGDQIQFCRFVPLLKAHGAGRVTLVCQRPLKALFETLVGVDALVAADVVDNAFTTGDVDLSDHDVWTFPLTLPLHLKTEPASLPAAIPYLRATGPDRVADAQEMRVGLVWRGNPRHHNDADRSLPDLRTLAPLWSVPGLRFVSLQTGAARVDALAPPSDQPIDTVSQRDFAETAQAVAALDLLISVDTSSAHLAGALGVPCWVLLPDHRTDWRWLRERDDSPWYPEHMRLFRQPRRGDWVSVVEAVRTALLALKARPASP